MLDAKMASALEKIISNPHFRRRVSVQEQRAQKTTTDSREEGRSLTWSMTSLRHLSSRVHRWRKRKKRGTTDRLLHTVRSFW